MGVISNGKEGGLLGKAQSDRDIYS